MKKTLAAVLMAVALLVMSIVPVAAYSNHPTYGSTYGTSFCYQLGEGTVTAQLVAGTTPGTIGTVVVWESNGKVNVMLNPDDAYNLTDEALYIAKGGSYSTAESQIPQDRSGNYDPDQFTKFDKYFSSATGTYSVPENKLWGFGNYLCIAAYALLTDSSSAQYKAWGDLTPVSAWKLPTTEVTVRMAKYSGSNEHLMDIELTNVPDGYSVKNQVYSGWCADDFGEIDINISSTYSAYLYSSLNLVGVPANLANRHWDMINYILNHHDPSVTFDNIQAAIWYFTDGILPPENDVSYYDPLPGRDHDIPNNYDPVVVQALIDDATANGTGFVPGPGQVGEIIVYIPGMYDATYPYQILCFDLFAPTKCYKECTCHHSCNPCWSPCQGGWEPGKGSTCNWNPCSWSNQYKDHCYSQTSCGGSHHLSHCQY